MFPRAQIEYLYDRSGTFEFTSVVRPLEGPGELYGSKSYLFDFGPDVERPHESYDGTNVRLRRRPPARRPTPRARPHGTVSSAGTSSA